MKPARFHALNPQVPRSAFHAETSQSGQGWNVIFTDTDGERYAVFSGDLLKCTDWIGDIPE